MNDNPRFALNRSVVMLVYKQPFFDWLHIADPNPLPMTLEDLRDDNDTLLAAVVRSASASKLPPVHQGGQLPMMRQRGISLIELIMFIVIISVALAGILLVMNTTNKSSADPLVTKQALAIAESLLEEVELQPFTYCEPDDANAPYANAATSTQCPKAGGIGGVEAMGPETEAGVPETRGSLTTPFDNVNDYYKFKMPVGAIMNIANANTGVNGYSAAITMTQPTLNGIAGTDANGAPQVILIQVTVTNTSGYAVTLEGYRARYSPRAMP